MNFEELLKKYNSGILRGAAIKLAKKLKKSESTISRIVTGELKIPEALAPKIAKELGITIDQLMACFPSDKKTVNILREPVAKYSPFQETSITYVPVVGTISAETFNCIFEESTYPMEVLPVVTTRGLELRALKITGDCMEPAASDGDYVVVAAKSAYEEGSLVVAKWNGECTLKRIYVRGDKALLVPDNKKYKKIELKKEDLQIIGVVVYTIRKQAPKKL